MFFLFFFFLTFDVDVSVCFVTVSSYALGIYQHQTWLAQKIRLHCLSLHLWWNTRPHCIFTLAKPSENVLSKKFPMRPRYWVSFKLHAAQMCRSCMHNAAQRGGEHLWKHHHDDVIAFSTWLMNLSLCIPVHYKTELYDPRTGGFAPPSAGNESFVHMTLSHTMHESIYLTICYPISSRYRHARRSERSRWQNHSLPSLQCRR